MPKRSVKPTGDSGFSKTLKPTAPSAPRRPVSNNPKNNDKNNTGTRTSHSTSGTSKHSVHRTASTTILGLAIAIVILGILVSLYFTHHHQPNPKTNSKRDAESDASTSFEVAYQVRDIEGKGKGLVAIRDIQQGELILSEPPLIRIPQSISVSPILYIHNTLQTLSASSVSAFYNLSYVHFPADLDPVTHRDEVAIAIVQTNAVSAGDGWVGVFPTMARMNHACSRGFNAVYTWRDGEVRVYALRPVRSGEEILTTYMDTKKPRSERRSYLLSQYAFNCTCPVCTLPPSESRLSDTRLTSMASLYAHFATWSNGRGIGGPEAIDIVRKIWSIGEEEGYWSERGRLAADAAVVAVSHSDAVSAREWARLSIEWYGYEVGVDSPLVREMEKVVDQPERHAFWGSRERVYVGGPGPGVGG